MMAVFHSGLHSSAWRLALGTRSPNLLYIFGLAAAELSYDSARSSLLYGGDCRQHRSTS